jgi:hypothetical protein
MVKGYIKFGFVIYLLLGIYLINSSFEFFTMPGLEIYFSEDYKFDYMEDNLIEDFVEEILKRGHLNKLNREAFEVLKKKYKDYMYLFRENLSKMGFSVVLLSNKMLWEDQELYTSKKIE